MLRDGRLPAAKEGRPDTVKELVTFFMHRLQCPLQVFIELLVIVMCP